MSKIRRNALVALGVCAVGLGYVSANPVHLSAAPLAAPAAAAALAGALAPPQVAVGAATHAQRPVTRLVDVDNVLGLRFRVVESANRYVAVLTPFSPEPQHSAHMTAPTTPVHALVRIERLGLVIDHPMTQVGASWVAVISKGGLAMLPGDHIYAGAWGPGTDISNPDEADYWHWWRL